MKMDFTILLKFSGNGEMLGPGVIKFLALINEKGSMKSACEEMGMSYSKGWKALRSAERVTGKKLVAGESGGLQGGCSVLTAEGKELLFRYNSFYDSVYAFAEEEFNENFFNN